MEINKKNGQGRKKKLEFYGRERRWFDGLPGV
jgi:hypothetical protein